MRADYDSAANAISISIREGSHADTSDEVHVRAIVALTDGKPVEVQLLYPDLGIDEPLAAVADLMTLIARRSRRPRSLRSLPRIAWSWSRLRRARRPERTAQPRRSQVRASRHRWQRRVAVVRAGL